MINVRHHRPGPDEYAAFYAGYVARVPAGDIADLLERQLEDTLMPLAGLDETAAGFAYAPGKWTIRQVIGHLCDAERVFAYRAMRFARGDETPLAGFDENLYVPASGHEARTLAELVAELRAVRWATVSLLRSLPADAWTRRGTASGDSISVRALACVIAGHELHHREVLAERYLGALAEPPSA